MSLINCPECGKQISDQSQQCIHCGFPLSNVTNSNNKYICNIDGINYNLKNVWSYIQNNDPKQAWIEFSKITPKTSIKNKLNIFDEIELTGEVPKIYTSKVYSKDEEKGAAVIVLRKRPQKNTNNSPQSDEAHCPKCNSTQITTGARGVNSFWGLIGASSTVNRCARCGYTWKPKYKG